MSTTNPPGVPFSLRSWIGCCWIVVLLCSGIAMRATTVIAPTFDELAAQADYVVRARVSEVSSYEEARGSQTIVRTRVTLDVSEVIAGNPPSPLVLTVLGGRVGDREMRVAGVPEFIVGMEEIFFVKDNGMAFYPIYAIMHGRYPIKRDKATGREYLTRTNGVPLTDVAEVATPVTSGELAARQRRVRSTSDALTPSDFANRVRERRAVNRVQQKNAK